MSGWSPGTNARPSCTRRSSSADDHEAHVAYLHKVIDERVPDAASLLDVACGTGWHLEIFQRWYDVAGTDLSVAMLERARGRLPDTRFIEADMREFDFGRSFDAVTCLSSSIAWMPDADGPTQLLRTWPGTRVRGAS